MRKDDHAQNSEENGPVAPLQRPVHDSSLTPREAYCIVYPQCSLEGAGKSNNLGNAVCAPSAIVPSALATCQWFEVVATLYTSENGALRAFLAFEQITLVHIPGCGNPGKRVIK